MKIISDNITVKELAGLAENKFGNFIKAVVDIARNIKNIHRLREIIRIREVLVDFIMYDNIYGSTDENWQDYFYQFGYAARIIK